MKIAVSATEKKKDSLLDRRFGRCDYFLIYDSEAGEYKTVENAGVLAGGGAGIAAASQLIDEGVTVVITGQLGPNAFELISKAGIEAYDSEVLPVEEAVALFLKEKLKLINSAGKAHHGMQ